MIDTVFTGSPGYEVCETWGRRAAMLVLRDVLVPVDFEPTSYHALAYARDLVRTFGARLHVLHVMEDVFALPAGTEGALSAFPCLEREVEADVRGRLDALLTEADRKAGAMTLVRLGASPASSIVAYAAENHADVIVMGTHGRSGAELGTIGSVAEQVVRTASCPVLTLRQHPSDTSLERVADLETAAPLKDSRPET
jgi:nucleotide-binding universal stress UspA family protein